MPLPWVRLDTAFPYNPKLLAMLGEKEGHRAGLVYLCSLAYSGAHGTDGFIPRDALPFIHGRVADARMLVKYGFWGGTSGAQDPVDNSEPDGPSVTRRVTKTASVTHESDDRHVTRHADPGFSTGSGWLIHGWEEFQESNEETQKRRERAQNLAAARWNGHQKLSDAERAKVYRDRKKAGQ